MTPDPLGFLTLWASSTRMEYFDISKVEAAIQDSGYWEDFVEWRISTITHFRITPTEQLDAQNKTKRLLYEVRVHCDYDLRCECPTVARALHFCNVFQQWIMTGWQTEGWPGWATKTQVRA
jgi:hypothetical protein